MTTTEQAWFDRARAALTLAHVAAPVRDELLEQARTLSREVGEPPAALFGGPSEWVEEQVAERRAQGLPTVVPDPAATWRDVPVMGMYGAAGLSAVFLLHAVIRREWEIDYSTVVVGAPLLAGPLVIAVLTAWEKTLARRSIGTALVAAGTLLVGGVLLIGLTLHLTGGLGLGTASVWYLLPLALGYGLLGRVADAVLPQRPRPSWGTPRGDDEWAEVLAGVLRLRADVPESRVRSIVAEARAHVAETGTTLHDEFGRPEDYGARFPVVEATAVRRRAWTYTALAGLAAVLALPPDGTWSVALLAGLLVASAGYQWWRLLTSAAGRP